MAQIEFPIAGLDRGMAWQKQPPYTSPDMLNVVPVGSITGRARGGSRPGLVNAYPNIAVPTAHNVGLIKTLHPAMGTSVGSFVENFSSYAVTGKLSSPWALGHGEVGTPVLPDIREDAQGRRMATVVRGDAIAGTDVYCSAGISSATALDNADLTKPYTITALVYPFDWVFNYPYDVNIAVSPTPDLRFWGFNLWCRTAAVDTNWSTSSVVVIIDPHYVSVDEGWKHRVRVYDSGTLKATKYFYLGSTGPIEVKIEINGTDASVFVNSVAVGATWTTTASGGHCMGFYTYHTQEAMASFVAGYGVGVDVFRTDYTLNSADETLQDSKPILVIGKGSTLPLYWIDSSGTRHRAWGEDECTLNNLYRTDAVEWGGKLWIADHQPTLAQGTGATLDDGSGGDGDRLSLSGYDFSGRGITAKDHVCVLYSAAGSLPVGTYRIASVAGDGSYIVLDDVDIATVTDCVFRVERALKVFTPQATSADAGFATYDCKGVMNIWQQDMTGATPKGAIPAGCHIIGRFQNRIILAGRPANTFYMSRAGDPEDWDAGADPDDPGRAFGGVTGEAGRIGNTITAFANFSDDYFILSTANELWLGRADIVTGSPLILLSDRVGILSPRAWCALPNGGIMFLGQGGLFELPPGGAGRPVNLSGDRLPRELKSIDLSRYAPMLAWDQREQRVIILLGTLESAKSIDYRETHWFYDYPRQAFFPWRLALNAYSAEAVGVEYFQPVGYLSQQALQLGSDGRVRHFSYNAEGDSTFDYAASAQSVLPIESKVLLGPFKTREDLDLMWENLTGVLGHVSASVTWKLFTGATTETAYANYQAGTYRATGTWAAGRNRIADVQARGASFFLLLSCSSVERWEVEEIHAALTPQMMYKPL